jgi:hypothetical protein
MHTLRVLLAALPALALATASCRAAAPPAPGANPAVRFAGSVMSSTVNAVAELRSRHRAGFPDAFIAAKSAGAMDSHMHAALPGIVDLGDSSFARNSFPMRRADALADLDRRHPEFWGGQK